MGGLGMGGGLKNSEWRSRSIGDKVELASIGANEQNKSSNFGQRN